MTINSHELIVEENFSVIWLTQTIHGTGIFTYLYQKKSSIHVGKSYHFSMDPSWVNEVRIPPSTTVLLPTKKHPKRYTTMFWRRSHPCNFACHLDLAIQKSDHDVWRGRSHAVATLCLFVWLVVCLFVCLFADLYLVFWVLVIVTCHLLSVHRVGQLRDVLMWCKVFWRSFQGHISWKKTVLGRYQYSRCVNIKHAGNVYPPWN